MSDYRLIDAAAGNNSRRAAAIKTLTVLIFAAALAALFLVPQLKITFDKTTYTLSPLTVVLRSLKINGTLVAFPAAMKIFSILVPILAAAGAGLLLWKKPMAAGCALALAGVAPLGLLLSVTGLEKSALALGIFEINLTLTAGWGCSIALALAAAVTSVWTRGGETLARSLFLVAATVSIGSVAFITFYMFLQGMPAILEIGLDKFILGTKWEPTASTPSFGILYMILASLAGTGGAILIGVPIGLLTAVFLSQLAPRWMARVVRPAVELLAGIPSVIYGFFGMMVLVPTIRKAFAASGTTGDSLLAVILILSIMILPTIINVAESALNAVPEAYKEASLALGATEIGTIFRVLIPAAKSGILAGVILGVGRAIGETMAIAMVAGNAVRFPTLLGSTRPLTIGIVFEMGYSTGLHRQALFGIGLVLFVFIMIVNITFSILSRQGVKVSEQ